MECLQGNCHKEQVLNMECSYCQGGYCSVECQVLDWNKNHQYICPVFTNFQLSDIAELSGPEQKPLGKGSYGEVKLYKHHTSGALYAVKIIQKEFIQKHSSVSVLLREIEIHRNLRHENIVQMIKCFEDDEKVFIVLEYASKGSLFRIIRRSKGLKESVAWKYFSQTCLGIKYLHDKDIIHRDLKPENILIDRFDNVKICDFGWCVQSNEIRNTFCGTLEYMAPEMLENRGHNYPVDLWALGILLFELINGDAPFTGKSDTDKKRQILSNNIRYDPKVSEEARDLINGLVKTNPEQRLDINQVLSHPWIRKFCNDENLKGLYINHPTLGQGEIVEHSGLVCIVKFEENFTVVVAEDTKKYLEVPRVSYSGIEKEAYASLEAWCGKKKRKNIEEIKNTKETTEKSQKDSKVANQNTLKSPEKSKDPVQILSENRKPAHISSLIAKTPQAVTLSDEFSGVFLPLECEKIHESRLKKSKLRQTGFKIPNKEVKHNSNSLYTKDSTTFQEVFNLTSNLDISEAALNLRLQQLEGLRKTLEATKHPHIKKGKSSFWSSWFGCLDR